MPVQLISGLQLGSAGAFSSRFDSFLHGYEVQWILRNFQGTTQPHERLKICRAQLRRLNQNTKTFKKTWSFWTQRSMELVAQLVQTPDSSSLIL